MRIITKEVYKFSELSEEIRKKVIERWYDNEDYPYLTDDLLQKLAHFDKAKIFSDVKMAYSLSNCQGDGLSFSSTINLEAFLKKVYSKKLSSEKIRLLLDYIYKVFSQHNKGMYCYYHKSDVCFTYNEDEKDNMEQLWRDVFAEIQTYYCDMCKKLEKSGYAILEYRPSDSEFSEFSDDNNYEYYSNGKMI